MELKEFIQKLIDACAVLDQHNGEERIASSSLPMQGMTCQLNLKSDGTVGHEPTGNTVAFVIRY